MLVFHLYDPIPLHDVTLALPVPENEIDLFVGCDAVETKAGGPFETLLPIYETARYHIQKKYVYWSV
jgi:hypothetical protein